MKYSPSFKVGFYALSPSWSYLHKLLIILLYGRLVTSHVFNHSYEYGLTDIYTLGYNLNNVAHFVAKMIRALGPSAGSCDTLAEHFLPSGTKMLRPLLDFVPPPLSSIRHLFIKGALVPFIDE